MPIVGAASSQRRSFFYLELPLTTLFSLSHNSLVFSLKNSLMNTHTHTHAYTKEEERLCQRHSLGEPQWLHGFSAQPSRPHLHYSVCNMYIYIRCWTHARTTSHLNRPLTAHTMPLLNLSRTCMHHRLTTHACMQLANQLTDSLSLPYLFSLQLDSNPTHARISTQWTRPCQTTRLNLYRSQSRTSVCRVLSLLMASPDNMASLASRCACSSHNNQASRLLHAYSQNLIG